VEFEHVKGMDRTRILRKALKLKVAGNRCGAAVLWKPLTVA
jgi:hypothetical protein